MSAEHPNAGRYDIDEDLSACLRRAAGIVDCLYTALDPTLPDRGQVELLGASMYGALWAALLDLNYALRLAEEQETRVCCCRRAGGEGR